jgi:hypothetical protein
MLEVDEYSAGTIRVSDDAPPSADVGIHYQLEQFLFKRSKRII